MKSTTNQIGILKIILLLLGVALSGSGMVGCVRFKNDIGFIFVFPLLFCGMTISAWTAERICDPNVSTARRSGGSLIIVLGCFLLFVGMAVVGSRNSDYSQSMSSVPVIVLQDIVFLSAPFLITFGVGLRSQLSRTQEVWMWLYWFSHLPLTYFGMDVARMMR